MAKTIKFNLICDGEPIRTIEDLQNNFSVEDVLKYYNNRLLHRWLSVRGYEEELERILAITSENQMDIIKQLITIFNVNVEEENVERSVYILRYLEERKELYELFGRKECELQSAIMEYKMGYDKLINEILTRPRDIAKIKANISVMVTYYAWIVELNHRELFYRFKEQNAVLAIMCLMMNEKMRKYYIPMEDSEGEKVGIDDFENKFKGEMYKHICKLITSTDFEIVMGEYLITFKGDTESYWKDLEPKGKKCMIISMGRGSYIRASNELGGDLAYEDIYNKFVIIDGIDYKSKMQQDKLIYMEV